jgi:hypothetical protein
MGRGKEFDQFISNPLRAERVNLWSIGLKRFKGAGLNFEAELGGQPDGAEHSQMVFGKPLFRQADGANDFGAEIFLAANPVMHLVLHWIKEKAIDRKITALGVGDRVPKADLLGAASVTVISFCAKGGDLKLLTLLNNDNDSEFFTDRDATLEGFANCVWPRVGCHIVVGRFAPEQKVADTAADPKSLEAGFLQSGNDVSSDFAQWFHSSRVNLHVLGGG